MMSTVRALDGTLRALARETNTPIEAVSVLYEEERAKLAATASVKRFISIIAGRRATGYAC